MGVEPTDAESVSAVSDCGCGDCSCCGAANALQGPVANYPALASLDADLQRVLAAWDGLPPHIRKTVLALVGFVDSAAKG